MEPRCTGIYLKGLETLLIAVANSRFAESKVSIFGSELELIKPQRTKKNSHKMAIGNRKTAVPRSFAAPLSKPGVVVKLRKSSSN
jgi:hypothetical protein